MEINGVHFLILLLYFVLNNNKILPNPAPVYLVILRSESRFYDLIKICIILIVPTKKIPTLKHLELDRFHLYMYSDSFYSYSMYKCEE